MIAMALSCDPKLLIADEPTTALDVTIQAQILDLIKRLRKELGMAVIMITHDLGVVAGVADKINVMYAGYIVESAPAEELFAKPRAPVHARPAALDPAHRRAAQGEADPDRGPAAGPDRRAAGLPVRAALHLQGRPLRRGEPVARAGRAGAHDRVLG